MNDPSEKSVDRIPRRYWAVIAVLMLLAVAISTMDVSISQQLVHSDWPSDLKKLVSLSEAFSHGMGVAVILILIFFTIPDGRQRMWRLVACPILAGIASNVCKLLVSRYRPQFYYQANHSGGPESPLQIESTFNGWLPFLKPENLTEHLIQSFPSAHTTTAFAFAIGLSWAFPRGRYIFFSLAVLSGLQRIASQSHWPSDVAFGAALGTTVGVVVCYSRLGEWVFGRLERWKRRSVESA